MIVLASATASYVNLMGPALDFLFTGTSRRWPASPACCPRSWTWPTSWPRSIATRLLALLPFLIIGVSLVKGVAFFGQMYLMGLISQRIVADLRTGLFKRSSACRPPSTRSTTPATCSRASPPTCRWSRSRSPTRWPPTCAMASPGGHAGQLLPARLEALHHGLRRGAADPLPGDPHGQAAAGQHRRVDGHLGIISEIALEALAGLRVVQAFGMEKYEEARFAKANPSMMKFERRITRLRAFSSPLMEVMAAAGMAFTIWWVGGQILSGPAGGREVLLLRGRGVAALPAGQAAGPGRPDGHDRRRLGPAGLRDPRRPVDGARRREGGAGALRRAIRYEAVDFAYGDRPVLQGLDLTIQKGEVVALVGPSGGGKTTISNLLPRFWDPTGGRDHHRRRDSRTSPWPACAPSWRW